MESAMIESRKDRLRMRSQNEDTIGTCGIDWVADECTNGLVEDLTGFERD